MLKKIYFRLISAREAEVMIQRIFRGPRKHKNQQKCGDTLRVLIITNIIKQQWRQEHLTWPTEDRYYQYFHVRQSMYDSFLYLWVT